VKGEHRFENIDKDNSDSQAGLTESAHGAGGNGAPLYEAELRYKLLFNNIPSGVAVYEAVDKGEDFVFKDFNKAGERIDRVKREDLLGRRVSEVFPAVKKFGLFEVIQRVWRGGKPAYHPVFLYKGKELTSWRENHVYKMPTGEVVLVYDDLTVQKKVEAELREVNRNLEEVLYITALQLQKMATPSERLKKNNVEEASIALAFCKKIIARRRGKGNIGSVRGR
jgi:hypothetical protein